MMVWRQKILADVEKKPKTFQGLCKDDAIDKLNIYSNEYPVVEPEEEKSSPVTREDDIRGLIERAIAAISRELHRLLQQDSPVVTDSARRTMFSHMVRLYTRREIGKGFSILIHTMWNIFGESDVELNASSLRLFRDTLEHLHAEPDMPHARARELRSALKRAALPVENRELRQILVNAALTSEA